MSNPQNLLTVEQFSRALPKQIKTTVDQDMVDNINNLVADPEMREVYRENLLSYTNVLTTGNYKIENYLNAVRYVSHKLMGATNVLAWANTFPDKYQRLLNTGADDREISRYVHAYNKTKLVNSIMEQTLVPVHVLNADMHQKALNVLADLMMSANSEKVRSDSATSLLVHLKPPEAKKIELDIGLKENDSIRDLRAATQALVTEQRRALQAGQLNAKDVAHSALVIEGEVVHEQ